MKVCLVVCALLAFAAAIDIGNVPDIDYSKVRPIEEMPGFLDRFPKLKGLATLKNMAFRKSSFLNERIVGGEEAERNSIPHQVALFLLMEAGTSFCGGSLISNNFVLTAAHCVDIVSGATVVLGAHVISDPTEEQLRIQTVFDDFIIHEGWNPELIRDDVALIHLPTSVELSEVISVIRLPSISQIGTSFAHESGTISGWGRASDDSNAIAPILRTVNANIMPNTNCNIRFFGLIQATHICTNGEGGRGACNGDSGGPMTFIDGDGFPTQLGLVSFGLGLGCERGWPSVFARITEYLLWIGQNSDVILRE